MKMKVFPSESLTGTMGLPGDKSISHRAILFSALARGTSHVGNLLVAGVTEKMLTALKELGVQWRLDRGELIVHGKGLNGFEPPVHPLDCGHSATTMRLLAGACSATSIPVVLDGSESLRNRPMSRIVNPLWEMGVPIQALGEGGTAPLKIAALLRGHKLQAVEYSSPVASAQVKSCLLLAGLAAEDTLYYIEPNLSRDHTERMLSNMGVEIEREVWEDGSVHVRMEPLLGKSLNPLRFYIPGDFSSAAFIIVASLITPGSKVTLREVGLNPTRIGLLEALERMGARIKIQQKTQVNGEPVGEITVQHSALHGIQLSGPLVVRMIDEIPIFAVAAAFAEGKTIVRDAEELREKESDRIAAIRKELHTLGVNIEERKDGFIINGGSPLQGRCVHSHGDHRMAMALAVAGLGAESPVEVLDGEIVKESFPNFLNTLISLGARVREEEKT